MKLAISVWLWRRRLLLFVFLASLKPFGFTLSLGICILWQGGLWVTVSAIVAWPGCLAVLRACFGLHTIRIMFERVSGTCVSLDLPALLHSGWQSPQWLYSCCGQSASTLSFRTDSFSNENGVSLRLCNVQKLVLSGPCFANVNVEKVGLLSPNIWTFWWWFGAALQNMW